MIHYPQCSPKFNIEWVVQVLYDVGERSPKLEWYINFLKTITKTETKQEKPNQMTIKTKVTTGCLPQAVSLQSSIKISTTGVLHDPDDL
jgi:hypothetical protein